MQPYKYYHTVRFTHQSDYGDSALHCDSVPASHVLQLPASTSITHFTNHYYIYLTSLIDLN
jgi:hypothetical protein